MARVGPVKGGGKFSPRRIEATGKQEKALQLRLAGRRFSEIAEALGYKSHTGAIEAVRSALLKTLQAPADEYRALTLERLTKVLAVFWPRMLSGDEKATDRVLRVLEQIRELLGLDMPRRVEVSGEGGGPILLTTLEQLWAMALESKEKRQIVEGEAKELTDGNLP